MKAIVYTRYGPPDVLSLEQIARPVPADGDIVVRIHAAEATKGDCELRRFRFAVKWFWLPLRIALGITRPRNPVLGGYFAGTIDSVGKDVSSFTPGDAVFGSAGLKMGAYGEYVRFPASHTIAAKPSNLDFEQAAAVPLGGLNALHFLRRARVREAEHVVVNGAGGSIGVFAVQIAKSMGAVVTAVDSGIKEAMLRRIGADHFVDYTREDFTRGGQSYDVIFDMLAKKSYGSCVRSLRPGGRYLMANPRLSDMLRATATSRLTDKSAVVAFAGETVEELLELKSMIEAGRIEPVVDRIYSMEQAAEAHRRVETEQRLGCVVISVSDKKAGADCVAASSGTSAPVDSSRLRPETKINEGYAPGNG